MIFMWRSVAVRRGHLDGRAHPRVEAALIVLIADAGERMHHGAAGSGDGDNRAETLRRGYLPILARIEQRQPASPKLATRVRVCPRPPTLTSLSVVPSCTDILTGEFAQSGCDPVSRTRASHGCVRILL